MHFLIWRHCRLAPCTSNHHFNLYHQPFSLLHAAAHPVAKLASPSRPLFVVPFLSRSIGAVHTSNRIIRDGDDNGSGSATSQRNRDDDEKSFLLPPFISILPSFLVPCSSLGIECPNLLPIRPSGGPHDSLTHFLPLLHGRRQQREGGTAALAHSPVRPSSSAPWASERASEGGYIR